MRPLTSPAPQRSIDAGSGDQLAETLRRLHHGGTPPERIGEVVWMQASNGSLFEVERGSHVHERLVAQGAVEVNASETESTIEKP
jgi:hypothetical protein